VVIHDRVKAFPGFDVLRDAAFKKLETIFND
jgi:hypothetical protein